MDESDLTVNKGKCEPENRESLGLVAQPATRFTFTDPDFVPASQRLAGAL